MTKLPKSLLLSPDSESINDIKNKVTTTPTPEREFIKHMLIGSSKAVMSTIHVLHRLGYAEVNDWSPLLPTANPGEVMSILVKQILVQ